MKFLIISVLLFFLVNPGCYAQNNSTVILWNSNVKLKWENFETVPDSSFSATAISYCGISYLYLDTPKFNVRVYSSFNKQKSWSKNKSDSFLLEHEQGHFDIVEFFARILRSKISRFSSEDSLKASISDLIDENERNLSQYQRLYDLETDFSKNREKQKKWNKIISNRLKKMKKYAQI